MWEIIKIVVIVVVIGLISEYYFSSPKAQVKRLWKEILEISFKMGKLKKEFPSIPSSIIYEYEKVIHKKEKMINALLDYYFDPEDDQDYIEDNRPEK